MISFQTTFNFQLTAEKIYQNWIENILRLEGFVLGDISVVFCDDDYLLGINQKYLSHDTYTDIITFDYTVEKIISGEMYISVERVRENAKIYAVDIENELKRVLIHGVLHLMGWEDKTATQKEKMRRKESEMIQMFHVEQS